MKAAVGPIGDEVSQKSSDQLKRPQSTRTASSTFRMIRQEMLVVQDTLQNRETNV